MSNKLAWVLSLETYGVLQDDILKTTEEALGKISQAVE
jgi:hypothetical protein